MNDENLEMKAGLSVKMSCNTSNLGKNVNNVRFDQGTFTNKQLKVYFSMCPTTCISLRSPSSARNFSLLMIYMSLTATDVFANFLFPALLRYDGDGQSSMFCKPQPSGRWSTRSHRDTSYTWSLRYGVTTQTCFSLRLSILQ